MDVRHSLILMLNQLLQEMDITQHQGAGYYTCIPFADRYNKLLAQARGLFPDSDGLMSTFDDVVGEDPKDPADKMKVVQKIHVEIGQLISLLESTGGGDQ